MTGGFTVVRIEKSEPLSLVALVQEKGSDTVARLEMKVSDSQPPKILVSRVEAIPRPADLAIPRLKEAEALAALTAHAGEQAKRDEFSGVVLVARHGEILLQKAWGLANRETGAPVTLGTRFRIGSMNKMFTSVATLQLVEAEALAGRSHRQDPSRLSEQGRRLESHRAPPAHPHRGRAISSRPEFDKNRLTLRDLGDYVKLYGSRGLAHEPGAQFEYSNYGFLLLGVLIEKVTGMSYYDYVRSHIFQPAGMTSTDSLPETEAVPNRSAGYMKEKGKVGAEHRHAPLAGNLRRRLFDGRRLPALRAGAGVGKADLQGEP